MKKDYFGAVLAFLFAFLLLSMVLIAFFGEAPDPYRKDLCPDPGYRINMFSRDEDARCVFDNELYDYEIGQINNPPKEVRS